MFSWTVVWVTLITWALKLDVAKALSNPGPQLVRCIPRSTSVLRDATTQFGKYGSGDSFGEGSDESSSLSSSSSNGQGPIKKKKKKKQSGNTSPVYSGPGFRVVRCFPHLPRRAADAAVAAGRVCVNGAVVQPSKRLKHGDTLTLDGKTVEWEARAAAEEGTLSTQPSAPASNSKSVSSIGGSASFFSYFKYHKPVSRLCSL